jgi:sterol desaturase/sphingolipid hydroxylase (fatty acid hydroxylase superfamily)
MRSRNHQSFNLSMMLLVGGAAALLMAEIARPLRRRQREPKLRRVQRNAAVGALSAATVQLCEQPLVLPLARYVERHGWGLLPRLNLTPRIRTVLALIALDYTLYLWHIVVHRVPWLWRFHRVHHADLDLDASTAIRFHFGELLASVPYRAAQVLAIGVDARTLQTWQTLTLMSVLFHHSNARLPERIERVLGCVLVTPRMHGIHHSREPDEMGSNWSSGLSVWDRLHGTLRVDVPQDAIEIGVPAVDEPSQVTLPRMLAAPFTS